MMRKTYEVPTDYKNRLKNAVIINSIQVSGCAAIGLPESFEGSGFPIKHLRPLQKQASDGRMESIQDPYRS
jgi:hypothetical protein